MESAGSLCACGCGQQVRKARFPSQQPRYIKGHQHRGEHNGNYRGGKLTGSCAVCGAAFEHFPSQPQVTCGAAACYATWQGLTTAARGRTKVITNCTHCGGPIERYPSQVEERNFCNRHCQGTWRGVGYVGPAGTNWRGGGRRYFFVQTRIRDGYRCVICGFHLVTEVHHITPLAAGGRDEFSNLVTVCPNHHRLAHVGLISLEGYRRHDWGAEQTAVPPESPAPVAPASH